MGFSAIPRCVPKIVGVHRPHGAQGPVNPLPGLWVSPSFFSNLPFEISSAKKEALLSTEGGGLGFWEVV